jgi:hypothetical protein
MSAINSDLESFQSVEHFIIYLFKRTYRPSFLSPETSGMALRHFITCSFIGERLHDEGTNMNVSNTA